MLARGPPSAGRMLCQHPGKYLANLRVLQLCMLLSGKYLVSLGALHITMPCAMWVHHALHGRVRFCMHAFSKRSL